MSLRTVTLSEAEVVEIIETLEARANHARGWSETSPHLRVREYQAGVATGAGDAAKLIRGKLAEREPRPALRLVSKDVVHG